MPTENVGCNKNKKSPGERLPIRTADTEAVPEVRTGEKILRPPDGEVTLKAKGGEATLRAPNKATCLAPAWAVNRAFLEAWATSRALWVALATRKDP